MAVFKNEDLIDQRTLIYIPCKSKDITQGIENNDNSYIIELNGEIYYNDIKNCIFGADKSNKNAIDNKYSKLILRNNDISKNENTPIVIEFYAEPSISINSNNEFVKIYLYSINEKIRKVLNFSLVNLTLNTENGSIEKILLNEFLAYHNPEYYFIQLDPNNGKLTIYVGQTKIYSKMHIELQGVIIEKVEFYLGMIMLKKYQKQINFYSEEYQNNPSLLYQFDTDIIVQHNIYYKDFRIFTGRYEEPDIRNRLNYVKFQKFIYILKTDIERKVILPENKYIDGNEIVNIIPNKNFNNQKFINPVQDIGVIEKNISNANIINNENFFRIIHEKGKFNRNPEDTSLYLQDLDISINSNIKNNSVLINDFTLEADIIITNKYNVTYTAIGSICNEKNKAIIQILCYCYNNYCELHFILRNSNTEQIIREYLYKTYYNYINRLVLLKSGNYFSIFINGIKEFYAIVNDFTEFNYFKTIIGKIDEHQNFTGYLSKFILSNTRRYSIDGKFINENINNLYDEPKIKFFTIYEKFDIIKQKKVKNPISYAPTPDKNYLIYVDFINNEIRNRGSKNLNFSFDSENNSKASFIEREFPGDSYSSALITSGKSKLSITNPSQLNLAELTSFTIEIDFKFITSTETFELIKLFSNQTLSTYLCFEHGHPAFYIGNKLGQQIKLKHYYPIIKGNAIHIILQKINNMFYLIIDDVLVFVNSISNLSQFFIEDVFVNQSSLNLMYINRFTVSDIARYNIQDLKEYPLDSKSLLYLPYDSESNFMSNKFPQSDNNNFSVSTSNPTFFNSYLKTGYGVVSSGTTTYFTLPNKDYDSKSISLHFWHRLIANNTIISNMKCILVKFRNDLFSSVNNNIQEVEVEIVNNYTLSIRSSILDPSNNIIDTEAISLNTNEYAKSLYNSWNSFAFTYDVLTSVFTLFVNGTSIYSGKLTYFTARSIIGIVLFTSYIYGDVRNIGTMYLGSIRLSEGVYYSSNFIPNTTGLLYKSSVNSTIDMEPTKQEIIYTKYPKNTIGRATEVIYKHKIPITEELEDYLTFEGWFYTTKNSNADFPLSIKFYRYDDILYTLYLTKKNSKEFYIRNSENISNRMSNKAFPENQWTHIALTYNKPSNILKVWVNGKLLLNGSYIEDYPLTASTHLLLYPGSGSSYFNDLNISPTLKYITDIFMPSNSVQMPDEYSDYDESQDIPYLIYNKHANGSTNGATPISETGFVTNLYNSTDIGHTIEFWLYTDKNERSNENPLSIQILAKDEKRPSISKSVHEIILSSYTPDNTDDIHWDNNISIGQNSGIILNAEKWIHLALIYNKLKNTIQLYYNGKKILDSVFNSNISLTSLKQLIITPGTGNTYIEGFVQIPQPLYETDFVPNNSILSGLALPTYSSNDDLEFEENPITVIGDHIGILDDHYITYLDFENCNLKDKSKFQVDWKGFGFLQYVDNKFSHDPNGKALLLTGSSGIYTNDTSLNFNLLKNFTIEMEIKNYTKYANKYSALFINFVSWIALSLSNDNIITANCHYDTNARLSTSNNIDLNDMIYIVLQRKNKTTTLYVNGTLISKYDHTGTLRLENFITKYSSDKTFDHIIDIGMTYNGNNTTSNFFSGYINKIAISDIARFDDGGETNANTIDTARNNLIIFYQPVKSPDYNALYRTTPKEEPWFWRYRLKNSEVYTNQTVGYNTKWVNYGSIGPNKENKNGFIEYANNNVYNKSFTFECWVKKDTTVNWDVESKILAIAYKFIIKTGTNGPVLIKYENGIENKLIELDVEPNLFNNRWNHFAITYNYYTTTLNVFINGKLYFITIDFKQFLPVNIQLFTNSTILNPTYFSSIRLSKGVLYKETFNLSLVNKPFTNYEENDKIDFNNLPDYSNTTIQNTMSAQSNMIDDSVIFYLPFKNRNTDVNEFLAPGVKSKFDFTSSNSKLY